jgi:hypothetical protein
LASANVVGYAGTSLQNGATIVTPQFSDVGASTFDLTKFQPVGSECYNNVSISVLDEYGAPLKIYSWTDAGGADWDTADVWVDTDDNSIVTSIPLLPGQAVFVQGSSSDQLLQSAGQVREEDVTLQLQNGCTLGGNPFPVKFGLADILPTGTECYNNISISVLDEYGAPLKIYSWTDAGGPEWDTADVWVDTDDNSIVTSVDVNAGSGLFIQGSNSEQYLTFPAPEL